MYTTVNASTENQKDLVTDTLAMVTSRLNDCNSTLQGAAPEDDLEIATDPARMLTGTNRLPCVTPALHWLPVVF